MKIISALIALRDILLLLRQFAREVGLEKTKEKLLEAKDKAIEERDQRYIEESLGAKPGKPSTRDHAGMYTRKAKDRKGRRDMAD